MGTLAFSTLGSALGGPIGGALGAVLSSQAGAALGLNPTRDGPRLRELQIAMSTYGEPIARHYGRRRVAGSVIWATELQEQSQVSGGKGQPSLRTYSYAANFAVALSSRPLGALGRIWADGKLLRGAGGDLKVAGVLRIHDGSEEQEPDPLIAASEGIDRCPAFRGIAYVVFEGLALGDFGNRIPALSFEIIADDGSFAEQLVRDCLPDASVVASSDAITGITVEGSLDQALAALDAVQAVDVDAARWPISIALAQTPEPLTLPSEPAAAIEDGSFAAAAGWSRRRQAAQEAPPPVLRYFDSDRDYLPATQHPFGRGATGQPAIVELPATLSAAQARRLVEGLARRRVAEREQYLWRTCELDPRLRPGSRVRLPGVAGIWRVETWEWRAQGVELALTPDYAQVPAAVLDGAAGTFGAPADVPATPTSMVAVELPWSAALDPAGRSSVGLAVSGANSGWTGAALFVDRGDGQLWPLGTSKSRSAVIGQALDALPAGSPLLLDRSSSVTVELTDPSHTLVSINPQAVRAGTNLALIGDELVQFASAVPLGGGTWRLEHLLRGRYGTEGAIGGHAAPEAFALLDDRLTLMDAAVVGNGVVLAQGHGDEEPIAASVRLAGIAQRPLSPVHPRRVDGADGSVTLQWVRRARGDWTWCDGAEIPLAEEIERYLVTCEVGGVAVADWTTTSASIVLAAETVAQLASDHPGGALLVRQQGTRSLSPPLLLTVV